MNAIIFPGQGAQYKGMGQNIFDAYPRAQEMLCRIDSILDVGIRRVCFSGSEDELKQTYYQQLAILAVSLTAYEIFKEKSIPIAYLSGLSLGEYACLYPAGVLELKDLLLLVKERASAMQAAAESAGAGMMAVINVERSVLEAKSRELGFYLSNINSSSQIVISLPREKMDAARAALEALSAKVIPLDVSGGFHSPFMMPARARLAEALDRASFNDARIPIVSNYTGRAHIKKEEIKANLLEQLTHPVLWKDCVDFLALKGVTRLYEIGPGKVLKGLVRKINAGITVVNIEKKEDFDVLAAL